MTKMNIINNIYIEEIKEKKSKSQKAIQAISFKRRHRVGKMRLARNQRGKCLFGSDQDEG